MNYLLIFISVFAGVVGGVFVVQILLRRQKPSEEVAAARLILEFQREMESLKAGLSTQVLDLSKQMNEHLAQNSQFLNQTHQGYREAVGQVQHRLGELQQATKSMMEIGRDIASLQDILKAPKLRGGMGEFFLGELLRQILPIENYSLQHTFRNGCKVDAVITLGNGLIPVDAKFPLENFKRILEAGDEEASHQAKKSFNQDVKKHIDAIASKYILPEEGTFEFALMYIPAENVYYETIIKDEMQPESLGAYALRKKVVPVSPNSFYAYLQAIVRGLRGLRIESSAQLILESLGQLQTDFNKCFTDFEKIGAHLGNAGSAYDKAFRRFTRLQDQLSSIDNQQGKPLLPEALTSSESPL